MEFYVPLRKILLVISPNNTDFPRQISGFLDYSLASQLETYMGNNAHGC